MQRFGYSVVPAPKGTYVLGDRCRPCTDWHDIEPQVRVGLRAMGFADDGIDDVLARVRETLAESVGADGG